MDRVLALTSALFVLLVLVAAVSYITRMPAELPAPKQKIETAPPVALPTRPIVTIRGKEFAVDLADTMARQARGLSGREELSENEGMYFIFNSTGTRGFWMRDMKFAIDILWIRDNRVVGVTENMLPEPDKNIFTYTKYYPPEPVDRVLEVLAGTVAREGFKAGDEVKFIPAP